MIARFVVAAGVMVVAGCLGSHGSPMQPMAVVTFDWNAWARVAPLDSAALSVNGELLSGCPMPAVKAVNRVIDGKEFMGIVLFKGKNETESIIEADIHGEDGRVLIHVSSKVPFRIEPMCFGDQRLAWSVSSISPMAQGEYPPGHYRIEIGLFDTGEPAGTTGSGGNVGADGPGEGGDEPR